MTSRHGGAARVERRGGALIVTVAVLAVVGLLALSFARVMVVERDAASAHVEHTRARFLAHAGMDYAVTQLQARQSQRGYTTWQDPWVYRGARGLDLDDATVLSLQAGSANGFPYSGTVLPPLGQSGRFAASGLQFALRIRDVASQIYVRRFEAGGNGNTRLLNNLGRLRRSAGEFRVLGSDLGNVLAAAEPAVGYLDVADVAAALSRTYPSNVNLDADLTVLRDLVTTIGWTDPRTVRPGANTLAMVTGAADRAASHPIDLNTAVPATLEAVFAGVQATWTGGDGVVVVHTVSDAAARWLAGRIQAERDRFANAQKNEGARDPFFYSFSDLERFLTRAVLEAGSGMVRRDAMTLLAQLDPNGRLLRFNPDVRQRYLSDDPVAHLGYTAAAARVEPNRIYADKSLLSQWTTEGCFDSQGYFRIESLGRVIAASGAVLAQHQVEAVVRVARTSRYTTQSEFVDLLSGGASAFVETYPESVPASGAPHGPSTTTGGLRLGENDSLPGTTVLAGLRSGDGAAILPAGHVVSPAPWTGLDKSALLAGTGDLAHDGFLVDPARRHVQCFDSTLGLPVPQGTLEFWTKFSERGLRQSGGMLWATNDVPERDAVNLPSYNEGIDTVAYYDYDPTTHRGAIHLSRTYVHFSNGIPSSGVASGLKWELNGKIRPNAMDILREQGRRLIAPGLAQMTGWTPAQKALWRETFAQWYAERVMSAFTGGQNMGPSTKIVGIGHAVIEDIEDLPVMCERWSSDSLDRIYPLIFEGGVEASQREWVAAAYHTVVNETDKYQYSYRKFAVNEVGYGEYYMEMVTDPVDGRRKKRWEALKNLYAKILERGLELPYAASRIEIVKEVYRETQVGSSWVPTADSWKPGEWHSVQFSWWDTTGYMDAWFDGRDDYDVVDEWGPLNVWSSRMRQFRNRVFFGPYVLDRASDDAGSTVPAVRDLYWMTQATNDRLIVRSDLAGGLPTADRFHAEPAFDPNGGFAGSYARVALPMRTLFGSTLDRATGTTIDWTESEPASRLGRPWVEVQLWMKDRGGRWIRIHRPEYSTRGPGTIGPAQRAALAGKPADLLELAIVFAETGEPRENAADALDQTPFLDDLGVAITTAPEFLAWTE